MFTDNCDVWAAHDGYHNVPDLKPWRAVSSTTYWDIPMTVVDYRSIQRVYPISEKYTKMYNSGAPWVKLTEKQEAHLERQGKLSGVTK